MAAPRWEASRQPPCPASPAPDHETKDDQLLDQLVHVCLVLILQDGPASPKDLCAGLQPLGLSQTPEAVEAALEVLVARGSVHCAREPSAHDRSARAYAITVDGTSWLRDATSQLRRTEVVLGDFLARCGERLVSRA